MKIPRRSSLRSGALRQRITIQSPTITRGADGGFVEGWSTGVEHWAYVEPVRGNESFSNDAISAGQQWRVLVRAEVEASLTDRIQYDGRTFGITSVLDPDQRGVIREIKCSEDVD